MDKQSPEEKLAGVEIKPVERECLERVFEYLSKFVLSSKRLRPFIFNDYNGIYNVCNAMMIRYGFYMNIKLN